MIPSAAQGMIWSRRSASSTAWTASAACSTANIRFEWPQRDEKDREHEAPIVNQILSVPARTWCPLRQSSSKAFKAQERRPNPTDSTGFGLVCSPRPVLSTPAKK